MAADVRALNRSAWDLAVTKGNRWTVPVSPETIAAARRGEWEVLLTPTRAVPRAWFPPLPVLELVRARGAAGVARGVSRAPPARRVAGGIHEPDRVRVRREAGPRGRVHAPPPDSLLGPHDPERPGARADDRARRAALLQPYARGPDRRPARGGLPAHEPVRGHLGRGAALRVLPALHRHACGEAVSGGAEVPVTAGLRLRAPAAAPLVAAGRRGGGAGRRGTSSTAGPGHPRGRLLAPPHGHGIRLRDRNRRGANAVRDRAPWHREGRDPRRPREPGQRAHPAAPRIPSARAAFGPREEARRNATGYTRMGA